MKNCVTWYFVMSPYSSFKIWKWKLHNTMINIVMLSTVPKWKYCHVMHSTRMKMKKMKRRIIDNWKDFLNPILFFMAGKLFCPDWAWLVETYYAMRWAADKVIEKPNICTHYIRFLPLPMITKVLVSISMKMPVNTCRLLRQKAVVFSARGFETVMSW